VNKDIDSNAPSSVLSLHGAYFRSYISPRVDSYISPNAGFIGITRVYDQSTNTTTINIPELLPGEGVMIRLIKRDLVIVNPFFDRKILQDNKENSLELFKIYPNPAEDFINIQTNDEIISASVYNNSGQRIINLNKNIRQIDISQIPTGTYILELKTKNGTRTESFIKK